MTQIRQLGYNYPAYSATSVSRLAQDVAQHVRVVAGTVNQNTRRLQQMAGPYACGATSPASLSVEVDPASFMTGGAIVTYAGGTLGPITAPLSHNRIDLVCFDKTTGVPSIVTGTEAASPTPPAVPSGKMPIAYITSSPGITALGPTNLQDVRSAWNF